MEVALDWGENLYCMVLHMCEIFLLLDLWCTIQALEEVQSFEDLPRLMSDLDTGLFRL